MIKIISGGQTGADRAALDAAIARGIPHGGWLPKGRKTEDGPLPLHYQLKELSTPHYRLRTEKNILDSDGTLICSYGPLTGGSALTEALAIKHGRPLLHINFAYSDEQKAVLLVEQWLASHSIAVLNVAGPRKSGEPRIYDLVYNLLLQVVLPPD